MNIEQHSDHRPWSCQKMSHNTAERERERDRQFMLRLYLVYFIVIKRLNFRISDRGSHFDSLNLIFTLPLLSFRWFDRFFSSFGHSFSTSFSCVWRRDSVFCYEFGVVEYALTAKYAISKLWNLNARTNTQIQLPAKREWTSIRCDNEGHHSSHPTSTPSEHIAIRSVWNPPVVLCGWTTTAQCFRFVFSFFIYIRIDFQLIYLFPWHAYLRWNSFDLFFLRLLVAKFLGLVQCSSSTSSSSSSSVVCAYSPFDVSRRLIGHGVSSSSWSRSKNWCSWPATNITIRRQSVRRQEHISKMQRQQYFISVDVDSEIESIRNHSHSYSLAVASSL